MHRIGTTPLITPKSTIETFVLRTRHTIKPHTILSAVAAVGIILWTCIGAAADGPKFQVLYNFAGGTDGYQPQAGVVAGSAGNLYGTTSGGGTGSSELCSFGCGTAFEVSPPAKAGGAWTETVLYRFSGESDGAIPLGKLVLDGQGNLYGTAFQGGDVNVTDCANGLVMTGCGLVFELSPPTSPGSPWTETVIHTFEGPDGGYPQAGLVFDVSGNLYGTTDGGGAFPYCGENYLLGCGVVFELSPPAQSGGSWTYAVLYSFTGGNDGSLPVSGVSFDAAGNLYGTTYTGGESSGGGVFELSPPQAQGGDWMEATLYSFRANSYSRAGVAIDEETNLFGTTSQGGEGYGTVFELSPMSNGSWTETTIYQFHESSAEYPYATPTLDGLGNVYGTAAGAYCGALYRLRNHEGAWEEIQGSFPLRPKAAPCSPYGALIMGSQNALFGTTAVGGTCTGHQCGTVFTVTP
jgi:hypothetical protein